MVFNDDKRIDMEVGTHQGRRSSPMIFDAILYSHLKECKIFEDFPEFHFGMVHDDICYVGKADRAVELLSRLQEALGRIGLEVNES